MRYIESNPVQAGIVARPEHRWSSYAANALREDNRIRLHDEYVNLGAVLLRGGSDYFCSIASRLLTR